MLVEVRPIPVKKWHGKEGKDEFSQPTILEVLYDTNTGRYATGLTEEEQADYEKKMGVDLSSHFNPNEPHSYWNSQAAKIKLPNHTVVFDTSKPAEFVKVKNLKASKFVANSMKEYENGDFPEALFVIFDENEDVELKATKIQKKRKAYNLVVDMSREAKNNIVQILAEKSVRRQSASYVEVEIEKLIEDRTNEFLKYAQMDKEECYTRASILEALYRNILRKEGSSIYYMSNRLAMSYEDAVQWFLHPDNQQMKVRILEKLNE